MNVWHLIRVDQANMEQLVQDILRAFASTGVGGRDRLFAELDKELRQYLTLVETILLPELRDDARFRGLAERAPPLHDVIRRLLDDLRHGDKSGHDWTAQFEAFVTRLGELFGAHVQLLTMARTTVDGQIARRLTNRYKRAKLATLRAHGRGRAHANGSARMLIGALIGLGATALTAAALRRRSARESTFYDYVKQRSRRNRAIREHERSAWAH